MILDWYLNLWIQTNKYSDPSIDSVYSDDKRFTRVILSRNGSLPLPVDLKVVLKSGLEENYTIPLSSMFGYKKNYINLGPWNYTQLSRVFSLKISIKDIKKIILDPNHWIADVNRKNNDWENKD
jgi:hypothetical protein